MKEATNTTSATTPPLQLVNSNYALIKEYYDTAGPDYEAWSSNYNMHFGYYKHFTDMFSLEKMLQRMNEIVVGKLTINNSKPCKIADLGCGVGTVARYVAKQYNNATIDAITISPFQIEKGTQLNKIQKLTNQVKMVYDNYEDLHYPNNHFDHSYALESVCHSQYEDKALFIAEMARTLKKNGTFCIADGFIKHSNALPKSFTVLYNKIVKCWALPCFGQLPKFVDCLKNNGLTNITVKEISYNIAPSVGYVPLVCCKFFIKELWRNKSLRMHPQRWNNVCAPLLGMLLGLYRRHFGYYLISGIKA